MTKTGFLTLSASALFAILAMSPALADEAATAADTQATIVDTSTKDDAAAPAADDKTAEPAADNGTATSAPKE